MDLKEFVFDEKQIMRSFGYVARSSPKKQFEKNRTDEEVIRYSASSSNDNINDMDQTQAVDDSYYNQALGW